MEFESNEGEQRPQRSYGKTAAVLGGAAAVAGAMWGAHAYRKRTATAGKINSVMETALTACEVAPEHGLRRQRNPSEPPVPHESRVPTEPRVPAA